MCSLSNEMLMSEPLSAPLSSIFFVDNLRRYLPLRPGNPMHQSNLDCPRAIITARAQIIIASSRESSLNELERNASKAGFQERLKLAIWDPAAFFRWNDIYIDSSGHNPARQGCAEGFLRHTKSRSSESHPFAWKKVGVFLDSRNPVKTGMYAPNVLYVKGNAYMEHRCAHAVDRTSSEREGTKTLLWFPKMSVLAQAVLRQKYAYLPAAPQRKIASPFASVGTRVMGSQSGLNVESRYAGSYEARKLYCWKGIQVGSQRIRVIIIM